MTLEELLNTIGFHFESNKFERQNNQLLKFNIQIEDKSEIIFHPNGRKEYKTLETKFIDIDNNEQTITLKYKYKG